MAYETIAVNGAGNGIVILTLNRAPVNALGRQLSYNFV